MKSLRQAIRDNRRFHKYERMLRRIRLRIFNYEDQGKLENAQRVIARIKASADPPGRSGRDDKRTGCWTG